MPPCRYMTDEHFWHVYFTLARKNLPDRAYSWTASDVLPSFGGAAAWLACSVAGLRRGWPAACAGSSLALIEFQCSAAQLPMHTALMPASPAEAAHDDAFSLVGLGSQLMQLGSKLQSATQAGRQRGLELTSFGGSAGASGGASSSSAGVAGAAVAGAPDARPAPVSGMLEEDPDLEAYLQVRCRGRQLCCSCRCRLAGRAYLKTACAPVQLG